MPTHSSTRLLLAFVGTLAASTLLTGCASNSGNTAAAPDSSQPTQVYQEMPTPAQPSEPLPVAAEPVSEPLAAAPSDVPPTLVDYTVKEGDSLWLIARNHRTSVVKLKEWNSLTSDVIRVGRTIKVPATN